MVPKTMSKLPYGAADGLLALSGPEHVLVPTLVHDAADAVRDAVHRPGRRSSAVQVGEAGRAAAEELDPSVLVYLELIWPEPVMSNS